LQSEELFEHPVETAQRIAMFAEVPSFEGHDFHVIRDIGTQLFYYFLALVVRCFTLHVVDMFVKAMIAWSTRKRCYDNTMSRDVPSRNSTRILRSTTGSLRHT